MGAQDLTDAQWSFIEPFVPVGRKGKRGPRSNNRRFIHALIWMIRSGGRWQDLPERYGNYHTAKKRYYRWIGAGVLEGIFTALSEKADLEWVSVARTSIRAQAQASSATTSGATSGANSATKKKGSAEAQCLGRSRGGLGTKIHAAVDALGLPVQIVLSPGNRGDVIYGKPLVERLKAQYVIAGYYCLRY